MKSKIYQFRIDIQGAKPPIWRRFKINGSDSFLKLHSVIQIIMGWGNYHLHDFEYNNIRISDDEDADDDDFFFPKVKTLPERNTVIDDLKLVEGDKISYTYDFGDNWRHILKLEKIEVDTKLLHPICIKGKMNGPIEDCGGIWGYEEMLTAIKDPKHPSYEDFTEWMDECEHDPNEFNMDEINMDLKSIKL
ncbi:MAG: plasmid pRiA4b ORF-3 family protein [Bacteroidales bacterium]